jgi:hypothetical protein
MTDETQKHGIALGSIDVVIHHQNPAPPRRSAGRLPCRLVLLPGQRRADRKPHVELAACAMSRASCRDRAAVHFDQPPDQGQTDAQAALRPIQRAVRLNEEFNQNERFFLECFVVRLQRALSPTEQ